MSKSVQQVAVALGPRSYNIVIKPGLINEIASRLQPVASAGCIGVVTDRNVAGHYLSTVLRQCTQAGFRVVPIVLPPGEKNKTLATVEKILNVLARERFEIGRAHV